MVPAAEHLDFIGLCHVARETNTACTEDASFLIQLDQWSQRKGLEAAFFLTQRIPAIVTRVCHVIVLKPAFAGLITDGTIYRMVKQQELHGIPNRFMDPFR